MINDRLQFAYLGFRKLQEGDPCVEVGKVSEYCGASRTRTLSTGYSQHPHMTILIYGTRVCSPDGGRVDSHVNPESIINSTPIQAN